MKVDGGRELDGRERGQGGGSGVGRAEERDQKSTVGVCQRCGQGRLLWG